jgi:hypothetical protein
MGKFQLINNKNHQYSEWIETNLQNSYLLKPVRLR